MRRYARWVGMGLQAGAYVAYVVLVFLYIRGLVAWLGFLGGFVGILLFPGAVVYPVIYWLVEDAWPMTYLTLYGAAVGSHILGTVFLMIGDDARV